MGDGQKYKNLLWHIFKCDKILLNILSLNDDKILRNDDKILRNCYDF